MSWYQVGASIIVVSDSEFLSLYLGSNTSLLIKIGIITINTFWPLRNKFVYSYGTKICAPGFNELLESTFCYVECFVEAFSLQKIVKMLEEMVVSWRDVR